VTRVRLFAALREAAGTEWAEVESEDVAGALEELCRRFGEPFTARLSRSKAVLNSHQVAHDATDALGPDDELVLLPPFAGG